ncbi:UDP-glucose/GDP-mannose dehydrogenase family protein [Emcibacter sp. SYSU 3D8]|uniref:UDP-glucose dehydrogenase family protein n=1 Tax=Emcibacter sp. SYSU 3D8 TaxID=3133969 RepID=UPI0031FEA828
MRITMIGSGYVGLVSGACFSEFGHDVVCVDKDPAKIGALESGKMPIYEPGLDDLVARNVAAGRLTFTTDLASAVPGSDAVFIAVGTPSRRGDGHADLTYVFAAAREVADALEDHVIIVTKSTVPVGTGARVRQVVGDRLREIGSTVTFDVASNPEFLREGSAIDDFMRPNRVVCGIENDAARGVMQRLYRPLSLRETPMLFTSIETAELIKYAANAFLATKITFINEMADLCERVGADVQDLAHGIGLDHRIGGKFLHPGPGYGGSCFPKDTRALLATAEEADVALGIVHAAVSANDRRKHVMADRIVAACGGTVTGKTIAVLGLTFKPNTDDMRDSPSLDIVPALQRAGATIRAYDPEGMTEAGKLLEDVVFCADAYDAMDGADGVVIITEWNQFRALDLERARGLLKQAVLVDLRNIYQPEELDGTGFVYHSIGRGAAR